jgi:predicted amidohydrolase YtcJ
MSDSGHHPDTIFSADAILTLVDDAPRAEAVAVRDGAIVQIGRRDDVLATRGDGTQLIELGARCLLPGLIEPHTHPDLSAQCYAWVDVSGFTHKSVEGVEQALRDAVAERAPGAWIYAFGLDPMLTENVGSWGRERLDAIAPDNPVSLMIQSMHTVFVNSRALEAAGIDDRTPDPPGGGRYQRDRKGRLTGRAEEASALAPFLAFDRPSKQLLGERMWQQYQRYARAGLTTIGIPGLFTPPSMLDLFEEFSLREDVPIRTVAYLRHQHLDQVSWRPGQGNDFFRVQGVKLWYDGSPYSGTMLLDEPYQESRLCCCTLGIPAGTTGHANFTADEILALSQRLYREGWQVLTHAQGDRGTREVVDLYERALASHERPDHRWRLEHCALISARDLERAKALGVSPSFHINHVYYYGDELRDHIIGAERAERLMPVASAHALGHRVSLHADSPMYPPEPFRLVRTAVSRLARSGKTIGSDQAIPLAIALRAITIDAAWQLFAEDRVGSIEVGKQADFTVVDRDPFTVPDDELDRIGVEETWLAGRRAASP